LYGVPIIPILNIATRNFRDTLAICRCHIIQRYRRYQKLILHLNFRYAIGYLWWREDLTTMLRHLLKQVRQHAAISREEFKLLGNLFLVEHS
jgi:hypothetical protein